MTRNSYLKSKYGITEEQYHELLDKQGGGCALCGKTKEEEGKNLAVDHDHKTGEIRGILCMYCNHRVVGRHRDGPLLRKLASYVEQGTGLFIPKRKRSVKRKVKRVD